MNTDQLKEVLLDQKEAFNHKRGLIPREVQLDRYLKASQIVIVSGIRRSGKSSLLCLMKKQLGLLASEYHYFNFDDERIERTTVVMGRL